MEILSEDYFDQVSGGSTSDQQIQPLPREVPSSVSAAIGASSQSAYSSFVFSVMRRMTIN